MRWMCGTSSKPLVVRNTTRAPVRVMTALMPIVVPTTMNETSAVSNAACSSAAASASTGRVGVDGTFETYHSPLASSTATRSVNVPPVSMPTRMPTTASDSLPRTASRRAPMTAPGVAPGTLPLRSAAAQLSFPRLPSAIVVQLH